MRALAMDVDASGEPPIRTAKLRRLYDYWAAKRGDRRMPSRRDLDPAEIPDLLPCLILMEVQEEGRLRIRLSGTRIVDLYGADYTRRFLDELDLGDQRQSVLADYARCCDSAEAQVDERHFHSLRGVHYQMERLILPLSDDGVTVNKLLAGLAFDRVVC